MGGTREVSSGVAIERVPGGITTGIYEGISEKEHQKASSEETPGRILELLPKENP